MNRRPQSPRGNRRKRRDDPRHMSTSSLPGSPEGYYGGPPPAAPSAPAPPYNNTYSVPHSPISSNESIGMHPAGSRLGHMHHLPPHHGYPSAPAPPPGIRGGDAGHMYNGGRNTQAGNRPNVIHQKPPHHMQEYGPPSEFDYRNHPRAPLAQLGSRSSSRTRDRDPSPPGSAGGTLCLA